MSSNDLYRVTNEKKRLVYFLEFVKVLFFYLINTWFLEIILYLIYLILNIIMLYKIIDIFITNGFDLVKAPLLEFYKKNKFHHRLI